MSIALLLPPALRSGGTLGLIQGAAQGRFALQCCNHCRCFIYPVRDICPACLSQHLAFADAPTGGQLLAETTITITSDPFFRSRPPVRQGLISADCGVTAIALLHRDCLVEGRVRLTLKLDRGGMPILFAFPEFASDNNMSDDPHLQDLTTDPKGRRVLITESAHPVALPLARALRDAGATEILCGTADPSAMPPESGVTFLQLSAADPLELPVPEIVIHTPFLPIRSDGAQDLMQNGATELLRLARRLGPQIQDGTWLSLMDLDALLPRPDHAEHGIAQAALRSATISLRGQMARRGQRVLSVFCGALDIPENGHLPAPKTAPAAVARGVIAALRQGIEDSYIGSDAEALRDMLSRDPKAAERLRRD